MKKVVGGTVKVVRIIVDTQMKKSYYYSVNSNYY